MADSSVALVGSSLVVLEEPSSVGEESSSELEVVGSSVVLVGSSSVVLEEASSVAEFEEEFGLPLTRIGECVEGGAEVRVDGESVAVGGFDHFRIR